MAVEHDAPDFANARHIHLYNFVKPAGEEGAGGGEAKPWEKHLDRAKAAGTAAVDQFNGLDRVKKAVVAGLCGLVALVILIIVIVCAATPSGYSNEFRIVDCSAGTKSSMFVPQKCLIYSSPPITVDY